MLAADPGTEPPTMVGVDEGWVRVDATDDEIAECARAVLARLAAHERIERVGDRVWSYLGRTFRLTRLQLPACSPNSSRAVARPSVMIG